MKKIAYNPIGFFPYFKIEKNEIELKDNTVKIIENTKDSNNEEEKQKEIEVTINKFEPTQKEYIFFMFWELFLLGLAVLYMLFAFFTTKTDIFSCLIYLAGMGVAIFFVKKHKFVFAEIATALTGIVCLISLYLFFRRLEIVFNHIGMLFVSYFIVSYILFNLHIKREIVRSSPIWSKISNFKFFVIFDNGK